MKLHNILNSWDMNINLKITNFMGQVKTQNSSGIEYRST